MRTSRAQFKKNAIRGICWFVAFLVLFQVVFWLMANVLVQDFWDSQYAVKEEYLRARLAENPGRPLWLVMGSSRVEDGVDAGLLNAGRGPLVFNFGLGGADLFRQMISLRRVLAAGVKPQRVGIEILGALMNIPSSGFATRDEFIVRARKDELDLYAKYNPEPGKVRGLWLKSRFNPSYIFGANLPPHSFSWASFPRFWRGDKPPYDEWGWIPLKPGVGNYESRVLFEEKTYRERYFMGSFGVSDFTDRALRQMLEMCRSAGAEVFFVRMPESPRFREIYTPEADMAIEAYISRMQTEYGVPFIDGRTWTAETGFDDGHHLTPAGAKKFTTRMGAELFKMADKPQGR